MKLSETTIIRENLHFLVQRPLFLPGKDVGTFFCGS